MKTTLKRTMAALSAAAIVATSAAVLAVPTSAAGGTATIGTVEVTVEEAKAGQIKVPVSVDNNFVKLSLGAEWDTSELDCTSIKCNSSSLALKFAYSEAYDFAWLPFLSTDADRDGNVLAYDTANGATVAYLIFDIKDADIQPGDTYTITAADTGRDGTKAQFENVNGDGGLTTAVSGAIVVKGEPTTEEPTTEAPTTELRLLPLRLQPLQLRRLPQPLRLLLRQLQPPRRLLLLPLLLRRLVTHCRSLALL